MNGEHELIQALFRQEFSKMVAVIARLYGLDHIELAEDIVSETFLQAAESWAAKGRPVHPVAWLYAVAKQKTLYHFRRDKIYTEKVLPQVRAGANQASADQAAMETDPDIDFSLQNIQDSQLRMMFAICSPLIVSEAQIGLALRILCGFSIDEIAEAFLSNKEAINKRLFRAREKLRSENVRLELPSEKEIGLRLDNVLHTIYLLFSEGYYSSTHTRILRKDLCLEALRLGLMLMDCPLTNTPKTNALLALICFHASRFEARQGSGEEDLILYDDQSVERWDRDLITRGHLFLTASAQGSEISSYHLEAGIAFWHCQKEDSPEKWQRILQHYDLLLEINYSPSVALNRIYALYKVKGHEMALAEAERLEWANNHFYHTLLGELYKGLDIEKARASYERALALARTEADRQILRQAIEKLEK